MSDKPKTEPSSDIRVAATACWQMFTALTDEGFTPPQALTIIGTMLSAALGKGGGDQ